MRVIICGAGRVGYGIAERLSTEGNDVAVIDISPSLIRTISEALDVRGVVGHGSHPEVMREAGAEQADMLIAVTLSDEVNMFACQVAHSLFNIPTKIARIRSQSYLRGSAKKLFARDDLPIDVVISPEVAVGELILRRIALPGATDVMRFGGGAIVTVGIECMEDCPVVDTPLSQLSALFPNLPSTVVGIARGDTVFIPHSADMLQAGDLAYVVTTNEQVKRTLSLFGHEEPEAKRIIIAGGGNIGVYVAQALEQRQGNVRAKIIEQDRDRAIQIADMLDRTVVLNASVLDEKILKEADIDGADLMISVTNNDQVNILSAVIAKRLGSKAAIALINDPSLHPYVKSFGIDQFINPRNVTISGVLQHVRRGRIRSVQSVMRGAAEFIEADALDTSPLVGTPLRDLTLPEGVRIGAIYRNSTVIKPDGATVIRAKDRVIVFALAGAVSDAEQLFRVSLDYF
ncbi:MAG: Trk system potassium transporter TrkA [Rhizobiaceae bacterium]|nr:Trk system potassium transporter TrkA [Rhizobiaceae bacterium]